MNTITWNRDSHGLFDYQSRHIYKKTLVASNNSELIRVHNEILFISEN